MRVEEVYSTRSCGEATEPERTEVHIPAAVGDFLEPDVLLVEHVADVHLLAAPADPPLRLT